jgi:beta-phosphoglucomutase-like phosphatase (HAD superfamily)
MVACGNCALGKPAPDPFRLATERLGLPAGGCLALEDSPHGVRSAAAAGMMVVMVPDLPPASDAELGMCAFIAEDLHGVSRAIRVLLANG